MDVVDKQGMRGVSRSRRTRSETSKPTTQSFTRSRGTVHMDDAVTDREPRRGVSRTKSWDVADSHGTSDRDYSMVADKDRRTSPSRRSSLNSPTKKSSSSDKLAKPMNKSGTSPTSAKSEKVSPTVVEPTKNELKGEPLTPNDLSKAMKVLAFLKLHNFHSFHAVEQEIKVRCGGVSENFERR